MSLALSQSFKAGKVQRAPCLSVRRLRAPACVQGSLARTSPVRSAYEGDAGKRPVSARFSKREALSNIVELVKSAIPKFVGALAVAAVLMLSIPSLSDAASGGRMGGSGFSSRSGGSFSSGSSYGGHSSFRSAPRSAPGYGGYGMHSGGVGMYAPRQTVVVPATPSVGFFGFGYGYPVAYGGGGSSVLTLLILVIFAYVAYNALSGGFGGGYEDDVYGEMDDPDNDPMSVVKLQVGLLGSARELQRDLNRMGNTLDTSTSQGLHYLLQETVLALRRNPQYAMYGKTELQKVRGLDNAEGAFNRTSMEERGKFKSETLSNVGGRTTRGVAKVQGDGLNEMIVVTVIAAIDGKVQPTDMHSQEDLKSNLELLGSVPSDKLLALEVLWTPQDESDYFTKEELVTDYPTLNML